MKKKDGAEWLPKELREVGDEREAKLRAAGIKVSRVKMWRKLACDVRKPRRDGN